MALLRSTCSTSHRSCTQSTSTSRVNIAPSPSPSSTSTSTSTTISTSTRTYNRFRSQTIASLNSLADSGSGSGSSDNDSDKDKDKDKIMTIDDLEKYAAKCGLGIRSEQKGVYLRLEAYSLVNPELNVGYLTAFLRPIPLGLFQLDTIQVQNRRQTLGFRRKTWTVGGEGISFIMGSWALCWALNKGCKRAELLAVNDDDRMHQILIALYGGFGFQIMREIGDETYSIPDRLTWGASGTLMELDMVKFFKEWTPKFRQLVKDKDKEREVEGEFVPTEFF